MTSKSFHVDINKYILCVPQGGFNDILNQINICYQYSIKHDRILLIDCSKNYIFDFSIFFELNQSNIIYDYHTVKAILEKINKEKLSVYPQVLENVITNYQSKNLKGLGFSYENVSLRTFYNLEKDIEKNIFQAYDVIVHDACGGGQNFHDITSILKIKKSLINEIKKYLDIIDKPYLSIHVRNTDIKTDYISLFKNNKNIIHKYNNIFLSTDSIEVLNFFKNQYSHKNIFSFTKLKEDNTPLHKEINDKNPVFFDTLRDLVLLIHGDDLVVELQEHCGGFTRLVHHLYKSSDNKKFRI